MSSSISDAVTGARDSNVIQLKLLQAALRKVMEDLEFMEKKQQLLEKTNLLLFPERERIRAEHEDVINTLNNKLSEKATKQIILNETYNKMQDLKEQLVNVNNAVEDLERDMTREVKDFVESKKKLESNVAETEGKIQNQKAENAKKIKELRFAGAELFDKEEEISEKQKCIQRLQKSIDQLKATNVQRRSQLAQEQKMGEEQTNQNENLDKELTALTEGFKIESQALCDKILLVDEEMRQVEEINLVHQQMILSQTENFQAVRAREDVVLAFHMDDAKLLEASEHAHEEKLENIAKLKMEIKELDEEKKRLEESSEYDY
ncbi:myosin heavy chain, embryonic smooth muscle isoform-like [Polyodon spathula]|uniref:myosin heavy chain, embryonic smooth muscle isoform-like n=1 Tax=Polyodon spathula TaxID=7913 RepID=UPI001B7E293E|nr:myosin heavy chain, embryonic smooth muscle isoform-like [Polyodon spathula]